MAGAEYAEAADRFEAMLEQYPDGAYADQVGLLFAQSLHQSKALPRALQQYTAVVERASDEYVPDAMYGLAVVLHQLGRAESSGEVLDRFSDRYPDDELIDDARLLRGRVAFDLEAWDEAIELLEELRDGSGELADDAAYWTAKSELRSGRPARAADRLENTLREHPDSTLRPEMMFDRAVALLRSDQLEPAAIALADFREAHDDHDLLPQATALSASTLHQLERYDDSLLLCRSYERDHAGEDDAAMVAFLVGENEFLLKRYEDAVASYETFLEEHAGAPQRDKAVYRTGMALYRLERYDEAETPLRRIAPAADDEPAFRPALLALGDLEFQRGEWADAETDLDAFLGYGLTQPAADEALLKLGLAEHRQGRWPDAVVTYTRLLNTFDESPLRTQAAFERGQALVLAERDDDAKADFARVVDASDAGVLRVHALNHLGAIAMRRGEWDEAAETYERVAGATDDEEILADAMLQQGLSLMAAGSFGDAETTFTRLIDSGSAGDRAPVARGQRVIALSRQDRHAAALDAAEAMADDDLAALDPELRASVRYEQAWSLRGLDRDDEANEAYRALLADPARTPLHGHATLELAELEASVERYDNAVTLLNGLERTLRATASPEDDLHEQALYRLGLYEYRQERHREAARWLEAFTEQHPESSLIASARLLCGESLFEIGAHDRAAAQLQVIVDDHTRDEAYGPALLRLGECLAAMQEWSRSQDVFDRYLEAFPDSELWFQAQFGIGWALENQGRHEKAIEAYRPVADRHDGATGARAQFQIGECLYAIGRLDEAVRELLKVDILFAYPEWSAAALYEAGRCLQELNNPVDARKQYEQVQRAHGDSRWAALAAERLAELSRSSLPGHD
jgi:TolA-binding protein